MWGGRECPPYSPSYAPHLGLQLSDDVEAGEVLAQGHLLVADLAAAAAAAGARGRGRGQR